MYHHRRRSGLSPCCTSGVAERLPLLGEIRTTLGTAGTALTALGIGLVILSAPTTGKQDSELRLLGWVLVAVGLALLAVAFTWAVVGVSGHKKRRATFSAFIHEGNELFVRIRPIRWYDREWPELKLEMDAWAVAVEEYLGEKRPELVATLRSDADGTLLAAEREGGSMEASVAEYHYFLAWLPQRLRQMEKIHDQL